MAELLRYYLYYSIHSLTRYDYMALGWVIFLALLLLILALFVKRRGAAYSLLFLGMVLLFFGPPLIKIAMDRFIRAASAETSVIKPLKFSHALLLEGNVTNLSRSDFGSCDLVVSIYRPDTPLKSWAAWLKPVRVYIQPDLFALRPHETKPFKIIVDHFTTKGDFNVTVIPRCYP